MTNKLEKQFFQCFGIEPKKQCFYEDCIKDEIGYDEKICDDKCVYIEKEYPKITDRILLELICLCPDLDEVFFTDVEQLKETLLTSYIKIYKYYTEVERLSDCEKELKHQVCTLFEEG